MKTRIKILLKSIYFDILAFFNLFCFFLLCKRGRNKKELSELKNKYLGKRCFIICNGPSLKAEDLDRIHDNGDFSFGINLISGIYDKTRWRPNALIRFERALPTKRNMRLWSKCETDIIFMNQRDYVFNQFQKGKKIFAKVNTDRSLLEKPRFSTDASDILYSIGTSTYLALEMAYHLGFREIYIIGCDMSYAVNLAKDGSIYYNKEGKNYFFEDDNSIPKDIYPNPTWEQIVALDYADIFSREHGFRIYNATRGGCCESFERVDFDSLFPDK